MSGGGLPASADLRNPIPPGDSARLDRIDAAIASLRDEERRLGRLGLPSPLRRCRERRRYWEFLGAVFAMSAAGGPRRRGDGA